jgi:hypothetical protein
MYHGLLCVSWNSASLVAGKQTPATPRACVRRKVFVHAYKFVRAFIHTYLLCIHVQIQKLREELEEWGSRQQGLEDTVKALGLSGQVRAHALA